MDTSLSGGPRAGRDRGEQGALLDNGQGTAHPPPGRCCSFEERLFAEVTMCYDELYRLNAKQRGRLTSIIVFSLLPR
jgi:hypothetical protein